MGKEASWQKEQIMDCHNTWVPDLALSGHITLGQVTFSLDLFFSLSVYNGGWTDGFCDSS